MISLPRLLFLLLALGFSSVHGAANPPQFIPSVPEIAASGYLLMDYDSGYVLAEAKADERMEPASLTKLMTAYVVFHEIAGGRATLEDKAFVSEKAWRTPGSRMFIEVDSKVPVEQLLKGMIIQSGNDASVALAEHVAGSEEAFALLMNQYAQELGLKGTHFVNCTGLPHEDHYTTPRDMGRLAAALIREFPQYYVWYSEKEYSYNGIKQHNRNKLLWRDEHVDGIKTGHTDSAGYCLVASAKQEEMRLISVVMGTKSEDARARESQKLLDYGFRFFETHLLYKAGQPLKTARIWKGESEDLPLGLTKNLYVTVPRGQYNQLNASLTVEKEIMAPASKGQAFGNVNVSLGERTLTRQPLVSLQEVAEGSLWQRMSDGVMLLFE